MKRPIETQSQQPQLQAPAHGKSLSRYLLSCTILIAADPLASQSQAKAQNQNHRGIKVSKAIEENKQEVDDNVNPFDDGDSQSQAGSPKKSNKSGQKGAGSGNNSGGSEVDDSILDTNHFQEMGSSAPEDDVPHESLLELDDGLDGSNQVKKNNLKHEWGEKDIEKAFKTKQKNKKQKSPTPLRVKDDIDKKRQESHRKLTAHEKSLRERHERQKMEVNVPDQNPSLLTDRGSSLSRDPSQSGRKNTGDLKLNDIQEVPGLTQSPQNLATLSTSARTENEEDLERNPLAPQNPKTTRGLSHEPLAQEGQGASLETRQDETSYDNTGTPTKGDQKSHQSMFSSNDFDRVRHAEAGQDAYDLESPKGTYEPTVYAEDQALSILRGSSVAQRQPSRQSSTNSHNGENSDDSPNPYDRRGSTDSYDLDTGLFGDPFVHGALGEHGDNSGENFATVSEIDTPEFYETPVKTSAAQNTRWKLAATQGTSRHVRLLNQDDQWASSSPTLGRTTLSKNTLAEQPSVLGSDGGWKSGETARNSQVNADPKSPKNMEASAHQIAGTTGTRARGMDVRSPLKGGALSPEATIKGQKILNTLAKSPPRFTLSLEVKQNHNSLSQIGMKYQVMQDSLLKNTVSKGSLKYGVIGYPLRELGLSSSQDLKTKQESFFSSFFTDGKTTDELAFWQHLKTGMIIAIIGVLGLSLTAGRYLLTRGRRHQLALGHQGSARSSGRS